MPSISAATLDGRHVPLDDSTIAPLGAVLGDRLLRRDSPGYDEARTIWNAMIDRRPALIARCTSSSDVQQAVRFAARAQLLVSIRGGGHNIAGTAVVDDGLMIDLSPMKRVAIDTASRTATVEPGATLREFDAAAQDAGLATPLGINSTTGVAGLTLGGGFGWLSRQHGLTIDNLLSADVVTADGVERRASADQQEDLFWAIRGGGGNFGVATRFQYRLHRVGPEVFAGLVVHPFEDTRSVVERYRSFTATEPNELTTWLVFRKAPPLPFLPADWHGREVVVLAFLHSGDPDDGERLVEPLRRFGRPIGEHVGRMPYAAFQQAFDPLLTPGARNYWKSHDFARITDPMVDRVADFASRLPSPQCEIFVAHLGGAIRDVRNDATAYGRRDAEYLMNVHTRWDDRSGDGACIRWARDFFAAMAPYALGSVYVNFMPEDERDRVPSAFGGNFARLAAIKAKYDPANLFRMNQNVQPAAV